jgi:protein-tyrosine-phosphatase/DNA-binding transcriptional ArsR family regulator
VVDRQGSSLSAEAPELLKLAVNPLRWRLLGELGASDRTVQELVERVGEPQNLISYHLGKLRTAGLVSSRRSSADRRDAYYSTDLARLRTVLANAGAAVHPGLGLAPRPIDTSGRSTTARVLFLCTGNSARSQMAEAITRSRSGGAVDAVSAGSAPKPLHPMAARVMVESFGIDIADAPSKHLDQFVDDDFDRVVTLCDRVREICPEFAGSARTIHWSIPDPAVGAIDGEPAHTTFLRVAAHIDSRVGFLLAELATNPEDHPTEDR